MKNKLLKSILLVSVGSPTIIGLTSYVSQISTSSALNVPQKNNSVKTLNSNEKTWVTFSAGTLTDVTFTGATKVAAKVGRQFCTLHQPTAIRDGRPQNYWIDKNGKKIKDTDPITSNMTVYPYFEADVELKNCLTVVALEQSMLTVINHGTNQPELRYSTNGLKWMPMPNTTLQIAPGTALYLRGFNPTGFSQSAENYTSIAIGGSVNMTGNVMTLIDDGQGTSKTIPNDYCFTNLFEDATGIKIISSNFLPATTLTKHCYDNMFRNCTSLNEFPDYLLSAPTLAESCYKGMFTNCTALTEISSNLLRATTLAKECYISMFHGCTGLTTLPSNILPATQLAEGCYKAMFRECSNITTIGDDLLKDKTLAKECYYGMFASCSGLTDLSSLNLNSKITDSATYCYDNMFYNCFNLEKAPSLPSTSLSEGCYYAMFYNCEKLQECPTLSASTMKNSCYSYMFYDCIALTSMANLQSTNLASNCYSSMYYGCTSLKTTYKLPATKLESSCYESMFYHCTSLVTPPTISATTLADSCCNSMFASCTSLTSSPALAATAAKPSCYKNMFSSCTSLTTIGYISLTSLSGADYACYFMFNSCSNAYIDTSSGTAFFKCPTIPSTTTNAVANMFQRTKNTSAHTPEAGKTYKYS